MKNKNQRDLEKHWAKEAAKKSKKKHAPQAKPQDANQTAAKTGVAADQVHTAAETLGRQTETLRADVDQFLANIRAA